MICVESLSFYWPHLDVQIFNFSKEENRQITDSDSDLPF